MDTYETALIIAGILPTVYLYGWVREFIRWRRINKSMKQKKQTPANFTAIYFTYSQEVLAKRIEKQAEELREITEGRKRG
jgi:hypothetical protein